MNWTICHAVLPEMWWFALPMLAFSSSVVALICSCVALILYMIIIRLFFNKIKVSSKKRHVLIASFVCFFLYFFISRYLEMKDHIYW